MLRIKFKNSPRISNHIAAFAALMLIVSTVVGISDSDMSSNAPALHLATGETSPDQPNANKAVGGNTHKKNKGFKASLFLFRLD